MILKNSPKKQYGYRKTQNLMLISNLVKMLPKKLMWKKLSTKKDRKIEFLTFITLCKRFLACNFLGDILHFFKRIPTQHRITQIEFFKKNKILLLELIANFKPKWKETAQKTKNVHTSAWVKKKSKK